MTSCQILAYDIHAFDWYDILLIWHILMMLALLHVKYMLFVSCLICDLLHLCQYLYMTCDLYGMLEL